MQGPPLDPRRRPPPGAANGAAPTDPRRGATPPLIAAKTQHPMDPRLQSVPGPWPPPGDPMPGIAPRPQHGDPGLQPAFGRPPSVGADVPSDPRQRRQQPAGLPVHPSGMHGHAPFNTTSALPAASPATEQPPQVHHQQQPFKPVQSLGQPPRPMLSVAAQQPRPPQAPPPQLLGMQHGAAASAISAHAEGQPPHQQRNQPPAQHAAARSAQNQPPAKKLTLAEEVGPRSRKRMLLCAGVLSTHALFPLFTASASTIEHKRLQKQTGVLSDRGVEPLSCV